VKDFSAFSLAQVDGEDVFNLAMAYRYLYGPVISIAVAYIISVRHGLFL
jgi:hypothetical protein